MKQLFQFFVASLLATLALSAQADQNPTPPANPDRIAGINAIHNMAGCFLVDYSYMETESLKNGYALDPRVYDVNRNQSVKEWVYVDDISPNRFRLQHILFATRLNGQVIEGAMLKHTGEDWEFNAPFLYNFTTPFAWDVVKLQADGSWTRRITHLDDGLRYQCAAKWNLSTEFPEWSCSDYAPIPGRETRDMGRTDYNTLQRTTRLQIQNGGSWLERQDNVKTIDASGTRTPLARETGKNWYIRLADSECAAVPPFMAPRKAFWELLRQTWDEVLVGDSSFVEKEAADMVPRYARMQEVEDSYVVQDLNNPAVRKAAHDEIIRVINNYRQ